MFKSKTHEDKLLEYVGIIAGTQNSERKNALASHHGQ